MAIIDLTENTQKKKHDVDQVRRPQPS